MPQEFKVQPSYQIWLGNQVGERQAEIKQLESIQVALTLNGSSTAIVTFPSIIDNIEFDYDLIQEDGWLEIWRGSNDSTKTLLGDAPFLLGRDEAEESGRGNFITSTAYSASVVFDWPVVAYDAGTSYTAKTDYADDMIKEIAAENVGASATDTNRDMSDYLSIQADSGKGVSVSKAFSRRTLSKVFSELCDASAADGTRLYWDVVLSNPANLTNRTLQLRTYTGQRGTDRGLSSDNPFIFSRQLGNLEDVKRTRDYSQVVNVAYALGQGQESTRNVQSAIDTARATASPWGYIKEGTRTATFATSDEGVTSEAKGLLREKRPRQIITAKIKNTPSSQFGVHWNHGDLVIVEAFGKRYETIISPISLYFFGGKETIDARLRIEE